MRETRAKLRGVEAVYHCITRVVGGDRLLDDVAREVLRRMIWQVADFSGVEILAYCIMSNHVHLLVRVPKRQRVSIGELVRRYRVLYEKNRSAYQPDPEVMEEILKGKQTLDLARFWRDRLEIRMADLSEFMKSLKQRFSIWYNKSHGRYGTLWAERFKSVLVEDDVSILKTVAAYIDLNPVRAGLVENPRDYRWSTYGEAMGGLDSGRKALAGVFHKRDWDKVSADYRVVLFGKGGVGQRSGQLRIPREQVLRVLNRGGRVTLSSLLCCRVRYFTDGAIIGSKLFVREMGVALFTNERKSIDKKKSRKRLIEVPIVGEDKEPLSVWRSLRRERFS